MFMTITLYKVISLDHDIYRISLEGHTLSSCTWLEQTLQWDLAFRHSSWLGCTLRKDQSVGQLFLKKIVRISGMCDGSFET